MIGRTLMIGLAGPALTGEERDRLRALKPGGVILFARNLESPASLAELTAQVREALDYPLLVALDQEGGRVSRLADWVGPTPTAAELAGRGPRAAGTFGRRTARVLRALGFNLDFAPVVDLSAPGSPNGIGDRSFGTDPGSVAVLAGAFLDGLQEGGVAGCLKHFPGLGDTTVDSHVELPVCARDAARLQAEDLAPYRALVGRAASVMVGHAAYPALDTARERTPASLSRAVVGLLRDRLRYAGLVVSDDLEMGAVADLDERGDAAVHAIRAGCDLLLYCADLDRAARARDALARQSERDPAFAERLRDAAESVARTAERWPSAPVDLAAWPDARDALAAFG